MFKTHAVKESEIERRWYVVDASSQPLGRLASRIATVLRGKHKPMYTPHLDTGDYVVVLNADKAILTGKKPTQKTYKHHSGYPGGFKVRSFQHMVKVHPSRVIEHAVKGMLPHNALGDHMLLKLKVYAGPNHPHVAQKVEPLPEPKASQEQEVGS